MPNVLAPPPVRQYDRARGAALLRRMREEIEEEEDNDEDDGDFVPNFAPENVNPMHFDWNDE